MKRLVFLLALANLLFFAFSAGYFGRPDNNPDAVRMQKQVNPGNLTVVGRGEPPSEKGAAKAGSGEANLAVEVGKEAPVAAKEEAKTPSACLAWNGLTGKTADRLAALVKDKFSDFKLTRRAIPSSADSWWVFTPQQNKADAEKKAAELKKLGITDFYIVQDPGPYRWSISLGLFSTELGAKERVASLKESGVKNAKIATRSAKETHNLEARGPAERQKALQDAATALSSEIYTKLCP